MKHWTRVDIDAALLDTSTADERVLLRQRIIDDLLAERDAPPAGLEFPGDDRADPLPEGGWIKRIGTGPVLANGWSHGVECAKESSRGYECSMSSAPHAWHIALISNTEVVAVWPNAVESASDGAR